MPLAALSWIPLVISSWFKISAYLIGWLRCLLLRRSGGSVFSTGTGVGATGVGPGFGLSGVVSRSGELCSLVSTGGLSSSVSSSEKLSSPGTSGIVVSRCLLFLCVSWGSSSVIGCFLGRPIRCPIRGGCLWGSSLEGALPQWTDEG